VTITVGTLNDGFYLEDDGPGIPEEQRGAIFRQGFTTSDAGSGTGLSIVADAAHTHGWDITVTESDGGGARFEIRNCLVVTPPSNELGTGEALALTDNCDVGNPTVSGETVLEEKGRATLRGAGADIYGADNEFQFAYTEVTGDVRISARITDLDPQHSFSKAGLMIRDALAADARHAHVGQTPEFGTELLWRTEAGEPTVSQQLQERYDDEWFRIDRVGNEVTCWISPDGDDWHPIDQRSVHFEDPIYVGLAVSSVVPRNLATGWFENVAIHRLEAR
ncbi:MAG: ATP-binding protein, partial [Halanaeroarchaeum sp.]